VSQSLTAGYDLIWSEKL